MRKNILNILCLVGVCTQLHAQSFSADFKKTEVKKAMKSVADWQIANFSKVPYTPNNWINAILYIGMFDWGKLAMESDKDESYLKFLSKIGGRTGWQPEKRMYHADDICVCQMYIDMYRFYNKQHPNMLHPTIARTDWVMAHPSKNSMQLNYRDGRTLERWTWCDALFMAPPVYARLYRLTGEKKYIRFMNEQFRDCYDYLYSKEDKLFFRDGNYFDRKEPNGEKMFWARGNGWVLGGLCQILDELPAKDKSRKFYETLFKEMCGRIVKLQQADGYWRASLLDASSYPSPETSGTAFYVYAFAYGINHGLLSKEEFLPALRKGWNALIQAIDEDGKLGYVQPVGEAPKQVTREMTELYGAGAFLMGGCEVYQMAE